MRPPLAIAVLTLLLPFHGFSADGPASDSTEPVRLDSGSVTGKYVGDKRDIRVFKSIPFAAPPAGDLRWKPPQPVKPWDGIRACVEYGPWCPQPKQMMGREQGRQSEDCLYLNVWTPAKPAGKLPVMVWIHGGGHTTGSGASSYYDGEAFARRGIVLVTINYRLGPFGYLAHPRLSKESGKDVSGNYGTLDQITALRWVKANIAAFGGDPECVTIFGESAGSVSVCHLMVTPFAKGLFHRAIAQSGGPYGRNRRLRETVGNMEPAEKLGERIASALGCDAAEDPLAALRAKSAEEILAAADPSQGLFGKGNKFGPIVDGWLFADDQGALFEAGKYHDVPLMIGTNADEGTVFLQQLSVQHVLGYRFLARSFFRDRADDVLKMFPAATDEEVQPALNRLVTVMSFVCPSRMVARCMGGAKSKTWLYHFTRVPPLAREKKIGAFHAAEIPYAFGNVKTAFNFEEKDRALAQAMNACWARFAAAGDPNGDGLPQWPAYTQATDRHMEFGDEIQAKSGLHKDACDLIEKVQKDRRDGMKKDGGAGKQ